jgi:hypothetical protein
MCMNCRPVRPYGVIVPAAFITQIEIRSKMLRVPRMLPKSIPLLSTTFQERVPFGFLVYSVI